MILVLLFGVTNVAGLFVLYFHGTPVYGLFAWWITCTAGFLWSRSALGEAPVS